MQEYVKGLTGIRESQLQKAPRFPEVHQQFRSWCGSDYLFIVGWKRSGDFAEQRGSAPAGYRLASAELDLPKIYGRQFGEGKRAVSLPPNGSKRRPHLPRRTERRVLYGGILQKVDWDRAQGRPRRPAAGRGRVSYCTGDLPPLPRPGSYLKDRRVIAPPVRSAASNWPHRWLTQPPTAGSYAGHLQRTRRFLFFRLRFFKDGSGWNAVRLTYRPQMKTGPFISRRRNGRSLSARPPRPAPQGILFALSARV